MEIIIKEFNSGNKFVHISIVQDYAGHKLYKVISGHIQDIENDLAVIDKKMIYNAPIPARNCFYRYKKECED